MAVLAQPNDLELAALISSKICHDVIGPVGAIYNGLEILSEDDNLEARAYALDVIRNVTETASAKLKFARFAFGAAGSAGAQIDLATARELSQGLLAGGKHTITWEGPQGFIAKDRAKLLLNMVSAALTALPRGGAIAVSITGSLEAPAFMVVCSGSTVRPPQPLTLFLGAGDAPVVDATTVQGYYTWRLSQATDMPILIETLAEGVAISARSRI